MANFTKRELLLTGAIITLIGSDLLQRRRLKKIPTKLIPYYGRLSLTAMRVAQNVRSLLPTLRRRAGRRTKYEAPRRRAKRAECSFTLRGRGDARAVGRLSPQGSCAGGQ